MWRVEIETRHPSLNSWLVGGAHWKKSIDKHKYQTEILWQLKSMKFPQKLNTPIQINCTQFTKRERDIDNTIISAKYLADSLVQGGYIPDDSPEFVNSIVISWKKAVDKEKVVYLISEVE